jgi:glutamate-1-semialdehyde 2,1-aminomutase
MGSVGDFHKQFAAKTQKSRQMFERARRVLPGGAARGATAFQPYPLYGRQARGAILVDVDGNEYVDFNLEGGSCILGHCAPEIVERVKAQLNQAEVMSIASELEVELAERLSRFIPSVEMMRFLNSGSEACAIAARVARGFTGKQLISMCEGHHHGQMDTLLFSHYGPPAGPRHSPETVPDSLGINEESRRSVVVLPFNDIPAAVKIIEANHDRLAAVFLEPLTIFGGAIPVEREFIQALRKVTRNFGILLVVDEVPAGVRIGRGGAVAQYDVVPDLFITGKALAGGLPVGMFGGRRDIMDPLMTPPYERSQKVLSSGTFSANPTVLSACLAVMDTLESGEVHRYINSLGEAVRSELREISRRLGISLQVTGTHSVFGIHFSERAVKNIRDTQGDAARRQEFALGMMAQGVLWPAARIAGFVSRAHKEEHIEKLLKAFRYTLEAMFRTPTAIPNEREKATPA